MADHNHRNPHTGVGYIRQSKITQVGHGSAEEAKGHRHGVNQHRTGTPLGGRSYHVDSIPIISLLVGSLSAPIGTLLFSGFSKSNQGGNPRWSGVPVRG